MNLAWLSLGALVVAMIVSCVSEINVGVLALALAWLVGVYAGGLGLNEVLSGFPVQLFLTLAGVTLLFTQAQLNGTLDRVAQAAVRICRGNAGLIPVMFFALACLIASVGPGQRRDGGDDGANGHGRRRPRRHPAVPHGDHGRQRRAGRGPVAVCPDRHHRHRPDDEDRPRRPRTSHLSRQPGWRTRSWRSAAISCSAAGGCSAVRDSRSAEEVAGKVDFTASHGATLAVVGSVLVAVLFLNANIGMAAFTGAVALAVLRLADHDQAIRKMPWTPILMVCGMSVLVALLEKTKGLDLFTTLLASISTPGTLTGVVALVTGLVSVYSSTSAVVLPAFLPTVPGLITRLGGDAFGVATSMNVGAHLVDMSPLSTTGAMCIAGIADPAEVRPTYNKLLAWGLSMTVIGALGCYLFF